MVGAILSWGIAWPLLRNRAGDWYPADLPNPANNFQGEFAYHVSAPLGPCSPPCHCRAFPPDTVWCLWCQVGWRTG
jgi:hypothetical protein